MSTKLVLRFCGLIMLLVAVIFLAYALTHPESGSVFYIGNIKIGSDVWRVFYVCYAVVMIFVFVASFFVKERK